MASYTTIDDPRQAVAMTSSMTPSCQLEPATNTMHAAAVAPTQAKPAITCRLRAVRSTSAPMMGNKMADTLVAKVTVYGASDPAAMGMLRIWRVPRQGSSGVPAEPHAATSAITVRYGPNSTVAVVVTKAEFAQS